MSEPEGQADWIGPKADIGAKHPVGARIFVRIREGFEAPFRMVFRAAGQPPRMSGSTRLPRCRRFPLPARRALAGGGGVEAVFGLEGAAGRCARGSRS